MSLDALAGERRPWVPSDVGPATSCEATLTRHLYSPTDRDAEATIRDTSHALRAGAFGPLDERTVRTPDVALVAVDR